jgi:hypothetical protein
MKKSNMSHLVARETSSRREGDVEYKICVNCPRHPLYPNTPPVTLHRGDECMVCHGKVGKRASGTAIKDGGQEPKANFEISE